MRGILRCFNSLQLQIPMHLGLTGPCEHHPFVQTQLQDAPHGEPHMESGRGVIVMEGGNM